MEKISKEILPKNPGLRDLLDPRRTVHFLREFWAAWKIPKNERSSEITQIYNLTRRNLLLTGLTYAIGIRASFFLPRHLFPPSYYTLQTEARPLSTDIEADLGKNIALVKTEYSPSKLEKFMEQLLENLKNIMKGHSDENEIVTFFQKNAHPGVFDTVESAEYAYNQDKETVLNSDFFIIPFENNTSIESFYAPQVTIVYANPDTSPTWLGLSLAYKMKMLLLKNAVKEKYSAFISSDQNFFDDDCVEIGYGRCPMEIFEAPIKISSYLWLQQLIDYHTHGEFLKKLRHILSQLEKNEETGEIPNAEFKNNMEMIHNELDILFGPPGFSLEIPERNGIYLTLLNLMNTNAFQQAPEEQAKILASVQQDIRNDPYIEKVPW